MSPFEGSTGPHTDVALSKLLRQLTVELDRFVDLVGEARQLHRTDLDAIVIILDAADTGDPLTPGRLASSLNMSASATTALLGRLERLGYVARRHSDTDRRKVELDIQQTARAVHRSAFAALQNTLDAAWTEFTDSERATIRRFLTSTIAATDRAKSSAAAEPTRDHRSEDRTNPKP